MKMIIYAHGLDIPGIGAAITKILFEKNCSIDNFKMVTLDGFFTFMIMASCKEYQDKSEVEGLIKESTKKFNIDIKVFEAQLTEDCIDRQKEEWIPYKISIICDDQTAVMYHFMREIALLNINVYDIRFKKIGTDFDKSYKIIVKIEIPINISLDIFKSHLEDMLISQNALIDINPIESLEM